MTDTLTDEAALLAKVLERLDTMAEHLARVDALLSEYEPIIRAVLDPAASGPLAWAVRRQQRRTP
jgi:hypothetical protein